MRFYFFSLFCPKRSRIRCDDLLSISRTNTDQYLCQSRSGLRYRLGERFVTNHNVEQQCGEHALYKPELSHDEAIQLGRLY